MITTLDEEQFYVIDYFLNGRFLTSTAAKNENALTVDDDVQVMSPQTGQSVTAKIVEIDAVSEDEYRVLLIA
jgi:hypothetical protein